MARHMITIMSVLTSRLRDLSSDRHRLTAGEQLFRMGEKVERFYLVLQGEIALERISADGRRLVLQRVRTGDIVAEASIFAGFYHCDATSVTDSEVASLPIVRLTEMSRTDRAIMEHLARHLAAEVQRTRARAEILSFHKVRDRLDAWLLLHEGAMPAKGGWLALAEEIGVSPEALYRELGRRRSSGR